MGKTAARSVVLGWIGVWVGLAGCDSTIECASPPEESHGFCSPDNPTCEGGSAEPVQDTRNDGAVDIGSFAPNDIPAAVLLNVPNEGRLHVPDDQPPTYMTNPPASGPHFGSPAETGFYCEALAPGYWVHSLEHGYIVILFDESQPSGASLRGSLNRLLSIVPPSPAFGNRKLVITPYSGLEHPIAVVAWNRQLYLDRLDLSAILGFYTTYIDQGPEQEP